MPTITKKHWGLPALVTEPSAPHKKVDPATMPLHATSGIKYLSWESCNYKCCVHYGIPSKFTAHLFTDAVGLGILLPTLGAHNYFTLNSTSRLSSPTFSFTNDLEVKILAMKDKREDLMAKETFWNKATCLNIPEAYVALRMMFDGDTEFLKGVWKNEFATEWLRREVGRYGRRFIALEEILVGEEGGDGFWK